MRETAYVDAIDSVPLAERTVRRPHQTRVLLHQFEGTFCFDTGDGYECGTGKTLERGRTLSLGGTIGIGVGPANAAVQVGYEHTVSQEFDHRAGPCETCQLMACRVDAVLKVWACAHGAGPFVVRHNKHRLTGGRVIYTPNCVLTELCPGCEGKVIEIPKAAPTMEDAETPPDAVTVEVSSVEGVSSRSSDSFLDDAVALVESLGETGEDEWSSEVLVSEGPGQFVSLSSPSHHAPIAVLSWDAVDRTRGAVRVRSDGTIPIIAAAPALGEVRAEASIFLPDATTTDENRLASTPLFTQSERFTTIAGDIGGPWDSIEEQGGEALLVIDLLDAERERLGRRVLPVRLVA
jgi:hypothetical protein